MSFEWTDESKAEVIKKYTESEPTPENSMDIVTQIAEEMGATPNGVRMILSKDGCYVKKTPAKSTSTASSGGSTRVSKADAQAALKSAISAKGLEPDDDIVDKLTGKAAQYFTEILNNK